MSPENKLRSQYNHCHLFSSRRNEIQQLKLKAFKGSPYPSHFIFEINVGKKRIRHRTTLHLNLHSIMSRFRNSSFNFREVLCRIRLFPTIISKMDWVWTTLKCYLPDILIVNYSSFE